MVVGAEAGLEPRPVWLQAHALPRAPGAVPKPLPKAWEHGPPAYQAPGQPGLPLNPLALELRVTHSVLMGQLWDTADP